MTWHHETLVYVQFTPVTLVTCVGAVAPEAVDLVVTDTTVTTGLGRALVDILFTVTANVARHAGTVVGPRRVLTGRTVLTQFRIAALIDVRATVLTLPSLEAGTTVVSACFALVTGITIHTWLINTRAPRLTQRTLEECDTVTLPLIQGVDTTIASVLTLHSAAVGIPAVLSVVSQSAVAVVVTRCVSTAGAVAARWLISALVCIILATRPMVASVGTVAVEGARCVNTDPVHTWLCRMRVRHITLIYVHITIYPAPPWANTLVAVHSIDTLPIQTGTRGTFIQVGFTVESTVPW